MDAFVIAGEVEGGLRTAQDAVAEGDGQGAALEEGGVFEEPGDAAAVDFDDAGVERPFCAEGEAGGADGEADGGGGEGPGGACEDGDHGRIIAGQEGRKALRHWGRKALKA